LHPSKTEALDPLFGYPFLRTPHRPQLRLMPLHYSPPAADAATLLPTCGWCRYTTPHLRLMPLHYSPPAADAATLLPTCGWCRYTSPHLRLMPQLPNDTASHLRRPESSRI
jgi:hypothetical protein